MKRIIIKENDANQRLDKFLTKSFKNLPKSLMYKYIRKKNIKINFKRCSMATKLCVNDVVDLYVKEEFLQTSKSIKKDFFKAPCDLDIVYEDENILLVNKPVGLIVHSDRNITYDTLINRVLHYLYDNKKYNPLDELSFSPASVNRIDRNTCGIVIFAKNAHALRVLNEKLKNKEIEKYYLALVYGKFEKKEDILTAYHRKNEKENKAYISLKRSDNNKIIKTKYKVIEEFANTSLLEVQLLTGRSHQIRAHLAFIGHPLVGDVKYNNKAYNSSNEYKTQALCSYKIEFCFKTNSKDLTYLDGKAFEISENSVKIFFKNYFNKKNTYAKHT